MGGVRKAETLCLVSILALVVASVISCENRLTEVIAGDEEGILAAEILSVPQTSLADGSMMTAHDSLVFTFAEAIVRESIALGGDLGRQGSVAWSTTETEDDTLTVSPTEGFWETGSDQTIDIVALSTGGKELQTFSRSYNIFAGVLVDGAYLNQSGLDGTRAAPFAEIQAGINGASTLYLQNGYSSAEVRVASSANPYAEYCEFGADGSGIYVAKLLDGIVLRGGFSTDFSEQDAAEYETIIEDTSTVGGADYSPAAPVFAGAGVTAEVEGFSIILGGGNDSHAGIFGDGCTLTIRDNTISGRESGAGGDVARGVFIRNAAGGAISGNEIEPGYAGNEAYGVYVSSSDLQVTGNSIYGGGAPDAVTLLLGQSNSAVTGNTLEGPAFSSSGKIIDLLNSAPTIEDNTLILGPGTDASTVGINKIAALPASVRNNDFNYAFGIFYHDDDVSATVDNSNYGSQTVETAQGTFLLFNPAGHDNYSTALGENVP